MENQHRKIKGYRELSQEEIDLMNRIKTKGSELLLLQCELVEMLKKENSEKLAAAAGLNFADNDATEELYRFQEAEPNKWADIGRTDIQTGIMALVRAVAQPSGGV